MAAQNQPSQAWCMEDVCPEPWFVLKKCGANTALQLGAALWSCDARADLQASFSLISSYSRPILAP